jgi:hypothetical protein
VSRQLTIEQAEPVLRCLNGLDVVLIGGQALQHWCREYRHAPELANDVFTSKDVDFQGTKDALLTAAHRLGAEARLAPLNALPILGVLDFDLQDGQDPVRVDFLLEPTGLNHADVLEAAVTLNAPDISVRVLHPIHCLISRIENVFQAPHKYDTEHGLKQLRASIICAREFILALSRADLPGALDGAISVAKICQSAASIWVWRTRQIDVAAAIPLTGLPQEFYEGRLPKLLARIDRKRARVDGA